MKTENSHSFHIEMKTARPSRKENKQTKKKKKKETKTMTTITQTGKHTSTNRPITTQKN